MSWAIEREAVALGEAEPIDGCSENSVVSIVCARSLFLAVGVRLCGVKVRSRKVREKGQRDQQAEEAQNSGLLAAPSYIFM